MLKIRGLHNAQEHQEAKILSLVSEKSPPRNKPYLLNRMNLEDAYNHPEIYNEPKPYLGLESLKGRGTSLTA